MKTIKLFCTVITTIFLFFILLKSTSAQSSEEEITKEPYRSDAIISMIINYLPAGWTFTESNGFYIIQKTDSIWVLAENTLNAPAEKKEEKIKRIKANGIKTVAKILVRYEKKWDFIKIQEVSFNNMSVNNEITALESKYNIAKLKDTKLSSKSKIVYTPLNEDDVKRINDYYAEKKQLEDKLIKSPDFSSQQYSLFVISKTGIIDEDHSVFPDKASVECYTIMALMREVCGK